MARGVYKQPGGKLVGVTARFSHRRPTGGATVAGCRIDGDFFLDGSETDARRMLADIERALPVCAGRTAEDIAETVGRIASRYPDVRMVGVTAHGIATAFLRAVAQHDGAAAESGSWPKRSDGSITHTIEHASSLEYVRRWRALDPIVIHDVPRGPQEQMDTDVAWAREVARGVRRPTLRFWEWASPAVVIGRFQSLEDEVNVRTARSEGFDIVRRCTGGGAMFIEPGNTITYSLYAPLGFAEDMSIEESYKLCDYWLVNALRGLGLDVRFAGLNDIATQYGKLGGAAQRRFAPMDGGPGAILHHVTLAYDIDAENMTRVLNVSREKMSDKAVKSAVKRVDPMRSQTGMGRDEVVARLIDAAKRVTM